MCETERMTLRRRAKLYLDRQFLCRDGQVKVQTRFHCGQVPERSQLSVALRNMVSEEFYDFFRRFLALWQSEERAAREELVELLGDPDLQPVPWGAELKSRPAGDRSHVNVWARHPETGDEVLFIEFRGNLEHLFFVVNKIGLPITH